LLTEANAEALARFLGLNGTLLCRRTSLERVDQRAGDLRDLAHGLVKGRFIGMGGPGEAADLANELERSIVDFRIGGGRLEIEERSNIPAHVRNTALVRAHVKRSGRDRARRACSFRRLASRGCTTRISGGAHIVHLFHARQGANQRAR